MPTNPKSELYIYPWPEDNGVTVSMALVDPEFAEATYTDNIMHNRQSSPARLEIYADVMRSRLWRPYRDTPLYFDRDGYCINGEHRLRAIVLANVAIPMIFVEGCDPTDIRVIDDLKARTIKDTLEATGMAPRSTNQLGTAIRYLDLARAKNLHRIRNDKVRPNLERAEAFDREPDIYKAFRWIKEFEADKNQKIKVKMHVPVWTLLRHITKGHRRKFNEFITKVMKSPGGALKPGTPEYALRDWFERHTERTGRGSAERWATGHSTNVLGPVINAWNAYAKGHPMQSCEVIEELDETFIYGVTDPVGQRMPFDANEREGSSVRFQGYGTIR